MGIERLADRYWFLGGFFGAISIVSLIPTITAFERLEFLRAFHAAVGYWLHLTEEGARQCNTLIGSTTFSAFDVNSIVFFFFFALPASIGIRRFDTSVLNLKYPGPTKYFSILMGAMFFQVIFMSLISPTETPFETNFPGLVVAFVMFGVGIFMIPGFLKSLASIFAFIMSIQALYYLNVPAVADAVNTWSCEYSECRSDE